jgi:hypothetical protein
MTSAAGVQLDLYRQPAGEARFPSAGTPGREDVDPAAAKFVAALLAPLTSTGDDYRDMIRAARRDWLIGGHHAK